MSTNKTVPTKASAREFIMGITELTRRRECEEIGKMMRAATGKNAKMWGTSIVGYGEYHYKYDSGREGDYLITGFSPRKKNLPIYIMPGFSNYESLLKKLGKHKLGRSCLYINSLEDVDKKVLKTLIERSVKDMKKMYKTR